MEVNSLSVLNDYSIKRTELIFNRLHTFLHGFALLALFYYRIQTLTAENNTPFLPCFLIFISELFLSFNWLLAQASKWRPVARKVYPERLPGDEELPRIDVFVCTADPEKEPIVGVMETVLSAMAMDYPSDKLHVYLSDDAGSPATLGAIREAWRFSRVWIPFCRKYEVWNRCPGAYFAAEETGGGLTSIGREFHVERRNVEKGYQELKASLMKIAENATRASRQHPLIIEVINDINSNPEDMPFLVYVAREKNPSHPHNFKAGALNVLLRVSAMISNSPYILVLDCDMYCNDPSSARQAMCFHLDSKISQNLAFVQFPQRFHNISGNDILDGRIRFIWHKWEGLDGLQGPILSGTGFYINRKALYGTKKIQEYVDLVQLQRSFGSSNEFIKSMNTNYIPNFSEGKFSSALMLKELQLLASCTYGDGTLWGEKVGFRYISLVEDYFTGLNLHCEGWNSVYMDPARPCFLGTSPICLNDTWVQQTRWFVGLLQVALSRFSPLLFGVTKMSVLQSMCYADVAYLPVLSVSLCWLAIVPQLCLIYDVPLYPKVSSPFFLVFVFVFLSSQIKHLQEIISSYKHSINSYWFSINNTWWNELRIWMMRSVTSSLYATLNTILEKVGFLKYSFQPTSKIIDDEQAKRYQLGIYDFQASALFMVPLCSLYTLNVACFFIGIVRILKNQRWEVMLIQAFIPLFGMTVNYPLFEGMVLRKDKGRVSPSISLISLVVCIIFLCSCPLLVKF